MKKLLELIKSAKQNDKSALNDIIDEFSPIINKYYRIMNYDEDFKSEMIVKLIILIKELNMDKFTHINEFIILDYLHQALRHHYILLSKQNRRRMKTFIDYEHDIIIDIADSKFAVTDDFIYDLEILNMLKSILTENEYNCITLIILDGYTAKQVADKIGITRQAVNQCKKRAIEKLKRNIINFEGV